MSNEPRIPSALIRFADLSDRQERGYALWQRAQSQNGMALLVNDETTLWFSQNDNTRAYPVERSTRNDRGTTDVAYRCACEDFKKQGRIDCKHIFAEKLRRGEIPVPSVPRTKKNETPKKATRRPPRKRKDKKGRSIRTSQRIANRKMPGRTPELIHSIKRDYDLNSHGIVIPIRKQLYRGGKTAAPLTTRALAAVSKISAGISASAMMSEFERLIDDGILRLRRAPSENTFSEWLNNEQLTPVLREFLRISAYPFRTREIGAMIDSSKVSQLMIAHAKEVDGNNRDKRPGADWMKAHTLVGVESLVVMAVEFSGTFGSGTHDGNFLKPLIEAATDFPLEYLLGDKAYLSEEAPTWLAERGIKAVIPLKKKWFRDGTKLYKQPLTELVEWFDRNNNQDFHEVYRLRPKIECLFSVLKRLFGGYCWSRGRMRTHKNANEPCTAWMNELLCKFIATNLRLTVLLEEETGVMIDYPVKSRFFPPPDEPLLKSRRVA